MDKLQDLLASKSPQTPTPSTTTTSNSTPWLGVPSPRGFSDLGEAIELRGCDILNADAGAGSARILFDRARPAGLDNNEDAEASTPQRDFVQSSADDQLLLFIPFNSAVKLHTIQVCPHPSLSQRSD